MVLEMSKFFISVVLPTFNEVSNIGNVIHQLRSMGFSESNCEIIVVDDSSSDGTSELVKFISSTDQGLRLVSPQVRAGLAGSIYIGIEAARHPVVAVMDTDGIHDPSYLPLMIAKLNRSSKLVIGSRYIPGGEMVGGIYPKLSKIINRVVKNITRSKVNDQLCGFFLGFREDLISVPRSYFMGFGEYFMYLINWYETSGIIVTEIPTVHQVRLSGNRKSVRSKMLFTYIKVALIIRQRSKLFHNRGDLF